MKAGKYISAVVMIVALAGSMTMTAWAEEAQPEAKEQTTCPVMGGSVSKSSPHVDVNGKRIYVCCAGCVSAIKADPQKYIDKLEADGVVLEEVEQETEKSESGEHDGHGSHDQ